MMPPMRNVFCLVSVLAVVGLVTATACAPADNTSSRSCARRRDSARRTP